MRAGLMVLEVAFRHILFLLIHGDEQRRTSLTLNECFLLTLDRIAWAFERLRHRTRATDRYDKHNRPSKATTIMHARIWRGVTGATLPKYSHCCYNSLNIHKTIQPHSMKILPKSTPNYFYRDILDNVF